MVRSLTCGSSSSHIQPNHGTGSHLTRTPAGSIAFARAGPERPCAAPLAIVPDTVRRIPATYWLEGALIGGTAAGLLLSTFVYYGCTHDDSSASRPCWDNALLGAGFGFAGGATLGGLLGGLIPKSDEPPVDSLTSH
jgi:hypothetical protein